MKKLRWTLVALLALWLTAAAQDAFARRSGGSFSGRGGFRSAPSRAPASGGYRTNPNYGGGSHFMFLPSFGWGMGGYGGGMGGFGSLLVLGLVGFAGYQVFRAVKNASRIKGGFSPGYGSSYDEDVRPERAYLYKLQLGLGRSARGLQQRLAHFAEDGDTSSETGLASLLSQTSLELMREKDSIRYITTSADGPMPIVQGESRMNTMALAERSRFDVERVRSADGKVRKTTGVLAESAEVLEYIVVTVIVASREPLGALKPVTDHTQLEGVLTALGGVGPSALLGLEVVWTPADPGDSMTEADLLTVYPDLKGI